MTVKGTGCSARAHTTGRTCRRRGRWTIEADKRFYCRQHAATLIRDRGVRPQIKHVITGQAVTVALPPLAQDRRPLPQGVDAIVAELGRARNRRAFNRCRRAVIEQISDLKDERTGITRPVLEALHAARTRLGMPRSTTGGTW